jgi:glycosyltransferase involved in cell wall biosynthesis
MIILFLNENPLPKTFCQGTISGKELRLRAAIKNVESIHVIAPKGNWVGDKNQNEIGALERKIHIHHIPPWPYYFRAIPLFIWGFYWARKTNTDVIEAESPIISGPAAVLIGKFFKKPSIVEVRASYSELIKLKVQWLPYNVKKWLLDIVFKSTLKHASGVIVNSHFYKKQLLEIGIASTVINPGIQLQSIKVLSKKQTSAFITLGFLGRLEPEKGVMLLIEAFDLITQNTNMPKKLQLLIAGEGSQKKRLEKFVENIPGLDAKVTLLGFQNAAEFLPKIDVLINPNIVSHPLEMVNVEAAFLGIPVICFGNNDVPETVIHNKTGIKVGRTSADDLRLCIERIIRQENLRLKLSNQSRLLAKKYSFTDQVKKLHSLYRNLQ